MFTFEDYMDALKGAGPKLKEMILERAEREGNLDFWDFKFEPTSTTQPRFFILSQGS